MMSNGRQGSFSRWIEKRRFYYYGSGSLSSMLDGNFDVEHRSGSGALFVHGCESNVFFQYRRPRAGGCMADLAVILVDWHSATPGR
jgi:hypothetical protein